MSDCKGVHFGRYWRAAGAVRWAVVILVLALATGCASTRLEPLANDSTRAALDKDEQELWATAEKIEQQIASHVIPIDGQEEVEQYLDDVLAKIVPDFDNPEMAVRIHLLPDPSPNAFILADGAMYVNTGLLALLENEAQLATVLGHEFCHFRNRHSYRERIKGENEELKGALIGGALGVLVGGVDVSRSVAELWRISSVSGYSRSLETEADLASLTAMVRAQYEPEQAIKAFEQLQTIDELVDQDARQEFATHPKLSDRIDSYRRSLQDEEIRAYASGTVVGTESYEENVFSIIAYNAQLNLEEGNYRLAQDNIARCLKRMPNCARAHFLQGELLRYGPSDNANAWRIALEAYGRCLDADPNHAAAHREAGLLYRCLGEPNEARQYLTAYLSLTVDAPDESLIEHYLHHLDDEPDTAGVPHRPPAVDEDNFADGVRTIGLMPFPIALEVVDLEKRREEFEATLIEELQDAGYSVVPSSAYIKTYEALKEVMGPLYDPATGEKLADKHDVLIDHTRREYLNAHDVDVLAYPAIVVAEARWNANVASWHGARESSTGKEGVWANLMAPSAYGTMPALSFRLVITDLYGEPCFLGFGGIQLCSRLSGMSFVDVPAYELLTDQEKNIRSVDLACQNLPSRAD